MTEWSGPALMWREVDGPVQAEQAVAQGAAVAFTQKAPGREDPNQDSVFVCEVDRRRAVLSVADGAGGLPAGARASGLAVEAICAALRRRPEQGTLRSALIDGFEDANAAVLDLRLGAATTLAAVEIDGAEVRPYIVGDSAILVTGQRGRVKLLTVPQSAAGYAVEAGFLAPEEAIDHEQAAVVLNVVGDVDMRIELGSPLALAAFDTLLVASDGVYDNLTVEEIVEVIRKGPLEQAAQALAARCRARMLAPERGAPSKPDDLSFVLYRPQLPRRRMRKASSNAESSPAGNS